ncbi:MAG: anhydro-N-acetylmuramic acid kinase [Chitinophagaceae bacterium]|nr:anhydro-N-acetylmuramic acid kinase [Chitinophagaceae bacterium]
MIYRVIGTMSGSSMDGLDIAYCTLEETGGNWTYEITQADCIAFSKEWQEQLKNITALSARELFRCHTAFGKWMGEQLNAFIEKNNLEHKVHFIASHGHTVFHEPQHGMTFQMGDGASIAAVTQLPVITDLRNMDVALGGQGAPIVPIGEQFLWKDYTHFLNLGGICNITFKQDGKHIAFDVCAANRILNVLAQEAGFDFDHEGKMAARGTINQDLLIALNDQEYFRKPFPKSLANEFGTETIYSILKEYSCSIDDKLRTVTEHIVMQIDAICTADGEQRMLVTGGGAHNTFLLARLRDTLTAKQMEVTVPDSELINYKEALVMAFIGVLRWREEENVLASVTGAQRNSIGGALWMGAQ